MRDYLWIGARCASEYSRQRGMCRQWYGFGARETRSARGSGRRDTWVANCVVRDRDNGAILGASLDVTVPSRKIGMFVTGGDWLSSIGNMLDRAER
jgi:hypothetical protein